MKAFIRKPALTILAALLAGFAHLRADADDPATAKMRDLLVFLQQHGYGAALLETQQPVGQQLHLQINGEDVYFLIDSACEATCLTHPCADDLKVPIHLVKHPSHPVDDVNGGVMGQALIKSMTLSGSELSHVNPLWVLSDGNVRNYDGILGEDFLHLNQAVVPLESSAVFVRPVGGAAPNLDAHLSALGFTALPLRNLPDGPHVQLKLNGQPLDALVASGELHSLFDINFVRKAVKSTLWEFHFDASESDKYEVFEYTFVPDELSLGPMNFHPLQAFAGESAQFKAGRFQAVFGRDLLIEHHAVLDFGHDLLWMRP